VPNIDWRIFSLTSPHGTCIDVADGIPVDVLAVEHGVGYLSCGFAFGTRQRLVYLSDVSAIPDATMTVLRAEPTIDLLILDCLFPDRTHPTHFCLDESLTVVRALRPKRTLFVGMLCGFEHYAANFELTKLKETEGLDVELAYDGMALPFEF
jgi:phosphoribosyl 1,2-cyclic phosphodiesterase